MKQEQVIELAIQAGFEDHVSFLFLPDGKDLADNFFRRLANFSFLVEQATLERAAEKADSIGHHWSGAPAKAFFDLAEEIRNLAKESQ